jgi:hypothetical protein
VWFRRGRLFMVSPDSLAQRARCQAETPLIACSDFRDQLLEPLVPFPLATETIYKNILHYQSLI